MEPTTNSSPAVTAADQTNQQDRSAVDYKSSKSEIWSAYKELKANLKLKKPGEVGAVPATAAVNPNAVLNALNNLRTEVSQLVSKLTDQVTTEADQLTKLQQQVRQAQASLEEIHQITYEAGRLEQLKDGREELLAQWDKEQEESKAKQDEEKLLQTKARQREQEDYEYQQQIKRRDLERQFQEDKEKLKQQLVQTRQETEADLNARQQALTASEQELADLRKKSVEFDSRLNQVVEDTRDLITKDLTRNAQVERDTLQAQLEANQKLYQQETNSLQQTIQTQKEQLNHLQQQLAEAMRQVKEIAIGAVEHRQSSPTSVRSQDNE